MVCLKFQFQHILQTLHFAFLKKREREARKSLSFDFNENSKVFFSYFVKSIPGVVVCINGCTVRNYFLYYYFLLCISFLIKNN